MEIERTSCRAIVIIHHKSRDGGIAGLGIYMEIEPTPLPQ